MILTYLLCIFPSCFAELVSAVSCVFFSQEVKGGGVGGDESPLKKRPLSMGALDDKKEGEMDSNVTSPS